MALYRLRGEFVCTDVPFRGSVSALVEGTNVTVSVEAERRLWGIVERVLIKQFGVAHPYHWSRLQASPVAPGEASRDPARPFSLYVDDNFHYMDESERYTLGQFDTAEEALAAARQIVDEYLEANRQPDDTPATLLARYRMFGEDPWISGVPFSAWEYAAQRCQELWGVGSDE